MVEPKIICWYQTWAKFIFGVGSINDLVMVLRLSRRKL